MALGNIFDIAGTGMNAQSLRLNTTASNLANAQSASSSVNEVYRSRQPVFAAIHKDAMRASVTEGTYSDNEIDAAAGVQVLGIVESDAPLQRRYEPTHPKKRTPYPFDNFCVLENRRAGESISAPASLGILGSDCRCKTSCSEHEIASSRVRRLRTCDVFSR